MCTQLLLIKCSKGWGISIEDYSSRGIYVPGETDVGLEKRPLHFLPSFGQLCQVVRRDGH